MDEYIDPETVHLRGQFFKNDDASSTPRAMSLCIDRDTPINKATVSRNISSPPAMPGTSQKRFSLRIGQLRKESSKKRKDSLRSNNLIICEGVIQEEVTPKQNPNPDVEVRETKPKIKSNSESATPSELSEQLRYWGFYFGKCGWPLVLFFCMASCIYQALKIYSDVWLNEVVDGKVNIEEVTFRMKPTPTVPNANHRFQLQPEFNFYIVLNILCTILAIVSVPFGQFAGHRARRSIHAGLVKSLLNTPVEQIQVGQFIQRFANDISVVDKVYKPNLVRKQHSSLKCISFPETLSHQLPTASVHSPVGQFHSD